MLPLPPLSLSLRLATPCGRLDTLPRIFKRLTPRAMMSYPEIIRVRRYRRALLQDIPTAVTHQSYGSQGASGSGLSPALRSLAATVKGQGQRTIALGPDESLWSSLTTYVVPDSAGSDDDEEEVGWSWRGFLVHQAQTGDRIWREELAKYLEREREEKRASVQEWLNSSIH
ncbi:hypothetical protein BOTBODRAFT_145579 [Botryobasidium botryosum FD-172 SS1]|uniref:Uncharacterized protein n=1 Tax=Botryobasidium botryosum (strain FD-172 SS1) TaxID=930990 RepID=A0A067MRF0_BOTB1|nr:hypothetical protein BOTBODRAFT_145579 [Botryobasidium botryosum FD-172 SS1]